MTNLEILKNTFKKKKSKNILEVGCNVGLVTKTLSKIPNIGILSIDNNKQHVSIAKKKLKFEKNIKFKVINFFDLKESQKFDVIIFREFFNILNYKKNKQIIRKSEKILNDKGFIILIDFYKSVTTRSNLLQIFIKSKKPTKNLNKFVENQNDFNKYFKKEKWKIKIFNKDLLDQHVSTVSKILEMIYPVKYTVFAYKKK